MRYVLIRYAGPSTGWRILFALRRHDTGHLVGCGEPLTPFTFQEAQEAIRWIEQCGAEGSSVEWEGTTW